MGADTAEYLDCLRQGCSSFVLLLLVPLTILLIGPAIRPVQAVHQLTFQRMQQYDLSGSSRGSSGVSLNCEVRTLSSASVTRRCVVLSWKEFIANDLRSIVNRGVVALIIVLPRNLSTIDGDNRQAFVEAERSILRMELQIPVYFANQTDVVTEWLQSLSFHAELNAPQTAVEELMQQITGDYFYLSSNQYSVKQLNDAKATNFVGRLGSGSAVGGSENQGVIVLVAHLDAFGVAPSLSFGANSDASGVAAVAETVRVLSKLSRSQKSSPKIDLMVLISGGGKYNFFGTKKWLDEQGENAESSLASRIRYAVCVDGVGNGGQLRTYVSRPPKEGSTIGRSLQFLNQTSEKVMDEVALMVHKKINLADDELAWEHEQFSLAKVPAFTLSRVSMDSGSERRTILDVDSAIDMKFLMKTVEILTKTLAADMYGFTEDESNVLDSSFLAVDEDNIKSWMRLLTQQPRSLQMLTADHPAMAAVKEHLTKHLTEVTIKQLTEKGDTELIVYGPMEVTVTASRTKQPFFDLLLTAVIGLYGALVYFLLQYVDLITVARRLLGPLLLGSGIRTRYSKPTKYQ
ncbi:hypothetical protein RvY_13881 [Ramazzottius varieornatus]|uniref:BOS complex subunit NCLN n=1 Tax=Ramazzottius varieornatus TaxID=947166 RepID=A0A1D1VPE5_RAMVA|nr:hypothetical protein RvY_13881 [Ramazzottius varieornatus]